MKINTARLFALTMSKSGRQLLHDAVEFETAMTKLRTVKQMSESEYEDIINEFYDTGIQSFHPNIETMIDLANKEYDKILRGE